MAVVQAYGEVRDGVQALARAARALAEKTRTEALPDLQELPRLDETDDE